MALLALLPAPRQLVHARDLLIELVARDMKLRYKRSMLGVAWSLLNPLAQLLVFTFVFRLVLPLNIPHYTSFLFTGVLVWSWFQSSLVAATGAITDNRDLIRRPGFPVALLPVATVLTNLIHFLLALPILLLLLVLDGGRLSGALLALPVVVALQFGLTLSLGYLIATCHVPFRDTQYLLGIALMLGFYLTPVFYDAAAIPDRFWPLYRLNPMVHLLAAYRTLLDGAWPDAATLMLLAAGVAAVMVAGVTIFRRASEHFVEEL